MRVKIRALYDSVREICRNERREKRRWNEIMKEARSSSKNVYKEDRAIKKRERERETKFASESIREGEKVSACSRVTCFCPLISSLMGNDAAGITQMRVLSFCGGSSKEADTSRLFSESTKPQIPFFSDGLKKSRGKKEK